MARSAGGWQEVDSCYRKLHNRESLEANFISVDFLNGQNHVCEAPYPHIGLARLQIRAR